MRFVDMTMPVPRGFWIAGKGRIAAGYDAGSASLT
jgi:hypothetical protein